MPFGIWQSAVAAPSDAAETPNNCRNRSKGSPVLGDCLPKSRNFCHFGAAFPPREPIGVKFCSAKQTHVPLGCAKFHINRYNESPLRGENADFWLVSRFNTGSFPLRGILPLINNYNMSGTNRKTPSSTNNCPSHHGRSNT